MNSQSNVSPASQQQISNSAYNRPSEPSRSRSSPTSSGPSHRPDLANGRGGKKSVSFGGNSTRNGAEGYSGMAQGGLGTVAEVQGPSKMDKTEREMYAALKASQEEAELSQARRLEEERIFNLALVDSAEQAAIAQRERELDDEREFQAALRESIKGKGRENAEHEDIAAREEREQLEMVLALSLEETSRRSGGVETSAQAFERYSREENVTRRQSSEFQSERSPYHGEIIAAEETSLPYNYAEEREESNRLALPLADEPHLPSRLSSFIITNPDGMEDELPPPAYDPLPLSSSPQANQVDVILPAIPRPGPAPLSRASSNDGSMPSRISYSFDNHRLSHLSSTPRAGSFSTTSSRSNDRRSSASSSILSLSSAYDPSVEPPVQSQTMSNAASFYSTSVGAALGFATPPATMVAGAGSSIDALNMGGGTSRFQTRVISSPEPEESQDPFDERIAAVDVQDEYEEASDEDEVEPITPAATTSHDYGASMYRDKPYDSPIIIPPKTRVPHSLALAIDTSYYRPQPPQSIPDTIDSASPATSELTPSGISPIATTTATTSSLLPSSTPTARFSMSTPSSGGLVDSCSVNAFADAIVLAGVRFDFVPPISPASVIASSMGRARSTHAPLDFEGPFPDMAQLSRFEDGSKKGYRTFAIEAVTFSDLLTYLMWHGNSQIEASPRDLAKEKGQLFASTTIEFFKSFTDGQTRVRVLIDLLSPPRPFDAFQDENLPSNFDRDCPNITIALSTLQLPLSLSKLATTLSAYHTIARTRKRLFSSSSTPTLPLSKSLKHLHAAINLIRSLNGLALFGQVQEDEEEEGRLIRLKGKLKRRKKLPGLVEGSEPGRRVGTQFVEGGALITPFAL